MAPLLQTLVHMRVTGSQKEKGKTMKSLKLFVTTFMTLASVFLSAQALSAPVKSEDVLRAANENNQRLIQEIRDLKEGKKAAKSEWSLFTSAPSSSGRHCEEEDDKQTCVPKCSVRYSNGSCASYGADYCGKNASCAENCTVRYSNGTCASYGADYCGDNVSCSENCTVRYSNGECASYGPDSCY